MLSFGSPWQRSDHEASSSINRLSPWWPHNLTRKWQGWGLAVESGLLWAEGRGFLLPTILHRVPKQQSPVTLNWLLWSREPGEIVPSLKLLSSGILLQQHIVTLFVIHDKIHSRCPRYYISKNATWHLLIWESARELSWQLGDGIAGTQYTFPPCTPHRTDTPVQLSGGGCGGRQFWAFNKAYFKCFMVKMIKWASTCLFSY